MTNQVMYTSLLACKCALWIEVKYCKSNLQKLGGILNVSVLKFSLPKETSQMIK